VLIDHIIPLSNGGYLEFAATNTLHAMPFYKAQRRYNDAFYSRLDPKMKTPEDRLGFSTPSHDREYARVHALEFREYAKSRQGDLRIDEFGAADGTFAKNFLDCLKEMDSGVYERTRYCAWDKSAALQPALKESLSLHRLASAGVADILSLKTDFEAGESDYVLCHELFDDLANRIVARRDGRLQELWSVPCSGNEHQLALMANAIGLQMEFRDLPEWAEHYAKIKEFMDGQPEKLRVAFPVEGLLALHSMHALLKEGGVLRIMDYGYLTPEIIYHLAGMSKNGIGRASMFEKGYDIVGTNEKMVDMADYRQSQIAGNAAGMQITSLVNFPFLASTAEEIGFRTVIETHLGWASRAGGEGYATYAHLAQGVAYNAGSALDGNAAPYWMPAGAMRLLNCHKLILEGKLEEKIFGITKTMGETTNAINAAIDTVLAKYFKPKQKAVMRVNEGKKGFVLEAVVLTILHHLCKPGAAYERIRSKAKNLILSQDLVRLEREGAFRASFSLEIGELEAVGFDRKAMEWVLFAAPHDYRISGSTVLVSFTAVKR